MLLAYNSASTRSGCLSGETQTHLRNVFLSSKIGASGDNPPTPMSHAGCSVGFKRAREMGDDDSLRDWIKSDEAKKIREEIEYWRQRAIFANTYGIPCEKDVNPEENDDQAGSDSDSDDDYHCFVNDNGLLRSNIPSGSSDFCPTLIDQVLGVQSDIPASCLVEAAPLLQPLPLEGRRAKQLRGRGHADAGAEAFW